jgi:hypothetical protein
VTNTGERNAAILRRRANGDTLDAIAKDYGITRERVRQIVRTTLNKALTTEEERARKRAEAKAERQREAEERRAQWAAERQREREEHDRRYIQGSLVQQALTVEPSWSSLNNFGWWLRENELRFRLPLSPTSTATVIRPRIGGDPFPHVDPVQPEYHPVFRAADKAIAQWLDGRANDHMTVLRLRRLTEVPDAA